MADSKPLRPRAVVALVFLIGLSGMPALSQPSRVDHSKANVNGHRALSVWPNSHDMPGDPVGYEAVLASHDRPESWLRFPAGQWHEVPAGEYWVLIEGKSEITGYPTLLHWSNGPYEGTGMALVKRLFPAGRVHLDATCPRQQCLGWLLHESSNRMAVPGFFQPEMLRWAALGTARKEGVLMPEGRVAAAVYDATRKEFVGLAAPVQVNAADETTAAPVPPSKGHAALILEMMRPAVVVKEGPQDVQVALAVGTRIIQPTLVTRTRRKVIAIWNDVPAGRARVDVSSSDAYLADTDIVLHSTKVEFLSVRLAALPRLSIQWEIPDEFKPAEPALTIVNLAGRQTVSDARLSTHEKNIEVTVPAAPLELTLKSGPWSLRETIDCSDGGDRSVQMSMRAIHVSGRVLLGREPVKATITFRTSANWGDSLKVVTDDNGQYEALFAKPHAYTAVVDIAGRAAPYPVVAFEVEGDTTKDISIPSNAYHFRVTSQKDGNPVAGARIMIQNHQRTEDDLSVATALVTDAQGLATAPPIRPGTMAVDVDADGFTHFSRPEEDVIDEGEHTLDIALDAVDATDTLRIVLPGGGAAAGAHVMVHSNRGDRMYDADVDGRIRIPRADTDGVVLVRAPGAARTARPWRGGDQTWTLDPPGQPLVIHAVRSDGSGAEYAAGVLWLDGVRLSGLPLAWLIAKSPAADGAGYWILHDLPPRPLEVLMWRSTPSNYQLVPRERLDSMRTVIGIPRPPAVDVRVLE